MKPPFLFQTGDVTDLDRDKNMVDYGILVFALKKVR